MVLKKKNNTYRNKKANQTRGEEKWHNQKEDGQKQEQG